MEVEVHLHSFSTLELDIGKWSASCPGRKKTLVPTEYEPGWALEMVWTFWRRENVLPLAGFEPLIRQPTPSSLYWLRYHNFTTTSYRLTSFQVSGVDFSMVYILHSVGLHFHSLRLNCLCLTSLSLNTVPGQCYNTALWQRPGWSTVLNTRSTNSYYDHCVAGNIFSNILPFSTTKLYYSNNLHHHILGQRSGSFFYDHKRSNQT